MKKMFQMKKKKKNKMIQKYILQKSEIFVFFLFYYSLSPLYTSFK